MMLPDLKAFAALMQELVIDMKFDNIFIDLDGVTADFDHGTTAAGLEPDIFKRQAGSYLWLPPVKDSIEAIQFLMKALPGRVWFLTKPPKHTPYAYVEKALWVQRYFGDDGLHALIVTQDKSLIGTANSVLVDDRPHKANVENFRGVVFHFLSEQYPDWQRVIAGLVHLGARRAAEPVDTE